MASGKTAESDKDCEWLVATCKSRLAEEDISGAKAWIFTARSQFVPKSFQSPGCKLLSISEIKC